MYSVERVPPLQVEAVRLGLDDARRSSGRTDIDPPGDVGRERALKIEDLADVAFVGVSPQVHVGRHLDQLRGHSHAAAGAGDGTLNDRVDVQLASDLLDRLPGPTVLHHRRARGDPNLPIFARSVISASVRPSAKYRCQGRVRGSPTGSPRARRSASERCRFDSQFRVVATATPRAMTIPTAIIALQQNPATC